MIQLIRKILKLDLVDEKIQEYLDLEKEQSILKSEIDELASFYTTQKDDFEKSMQSPENSDIRELIDEKYESFMKSHLEDLGKLYKRKLSINKKLIGLQRDYPDIIKAVGQIKDQEAFKEIKKAYKSSSISREMYENIIKAKQEKVKYADMVVWGEGGKMLLIQRSKDSDFEPNKWGLPGGHVDLGESFDDAAQRELEEETGLVIKKCEKIGEYTDNECIIEYHQSYLYQNPESPTDVRLMSDEHQDYKWVTIDEALEMDLMMNLKDNLEKVLNVDVYNKPIKVIKKAFELGLLDYDKFEKAHKYIRREGAVGNYKYIYAEPHGTDGGHTEEGEDKYKEKIEKLKETRGPENIEKTEIDQTSFQQMKEIAKENLGIKKAESSIFDDINSDFLPSDVFEKGKVAQEGEERVWSGKKMKKVGGKWVPVIEGKQDKQGEDNKKKLKKKSP